MYKKGDSWKSFFRPQPKGNTVNMTAVTYDLIGLDQTNLPQGGTPHFMYKAQTVYEARHFTQVGRMWFGKLHIYF